MAGPHNPRPNNPTGGRVVTTKVEASFAGPLPPPNLLKGYEDACPGSADRIIRMAETQGDHRREIEHKMADAAVEEMRRGFSEARFGQVCAFFISILFLLVGAYVATHGPEWVGALLGSMGISGIVASFIKGRGGIAATQEEPPQPQKQPKQQK